MAEAKSNSVSMSYRDCIDSSSLVSTDRPQGLLIPRFPTSPLTRFFDWRERARGRRVLRELDDRILRDVGLSRADVDHECVKHFWQP